MFTQGDTWIVECQDGYFSKFDQITCVVVPSGMPQWNNEPEELCKQIKCKSPMIFAIDAKNDTVYFQLLKGKYVKYGERDYVNESEYICTNEEGETDSVSVEAYGLI